mgnify:CR=1 FL=1
MTQKQTAVITGGSAGIGKVNEAKPPTSTRTVPVLFCAEMEASDLP